MTYASLSWNMLKLALLIFGSHLPPWRKVSSPGSELSIMSSSSKWMPAMTVRLPPAGGSHTYVSIPPFKPSFYRWNQQNRVPLNTSENYTKTEPQSDLSPLIPFICATIELTGWWFRITMLTKCQESGMNPSLLSESLARHFFSPSLSFIICIKRWCDQKAPMVHFSFQVL